MIQCRRGERRSPGMSSRWLPRHRDRGGRLYADLQGDGFPDGASAPHDDLRGPRAGRVGEKPPLVGDERYLPGQSFDDEDGRGGWPRLELSGTIQELEMNLRRRRLTWQRLADAAVGVGDQHRTGDLRAISRRQ